MGNWFFKQPDTRIILQGLFGAGKTSLFYRLKLGELIIPFPSMFFNVDVFTTNNLTITCWDIGFRDKMRPLKRHNYPNVSGVVYVIDSHNRDRLDYALDELVKFVLLEEDIFNTVVMVLANKQDLAGAMTAAEVEDALKQKYTFSAKSAGRHTVLVRPCSAVTMDGVEEAFKDFTEQLRLKRAGKAKVGLVPLPNSDVKDARGEDCIDISQDRKESFAISGVKMFCKNPFSLFKSLISRPQL